MNLLNVLIIDTLLLICCHEKLVGGVPARRHLTNLPKAAVQREEQRDGTHILQTKAEKFADMLLLMRSLELTKYDSILQNEEVTSLDLLGTMTIEELRSVGFKLGEYSMCNVSIFFLKKSLLLFYKPCCHLYVMYANNCVCYHTF